MIQTEMVRSCIDHINSAIDVDPWAREMAEEALSKQLQIAPDKVENVNDQSRFSAAYRCPACGGNFDKTGMAKFCYRCGQALLWPSHEEILEEIKEQQLDDEWKFVNNSERRMVFKDAADK